MTSSEEMVKSWMRLCKDPRTSSDLLENAAYWESINTPRKFEIRLAIARHRSAPSELLTKLSMVNFLPLQIAVAGHPNLSEATAGKILKHHLRELRRALAGNPKIPIFAMEKLAKDFVDVRVRLAKNAALTTKLMTFLARQKEREVRISLAQNPAISTKILEILSRDKEEDVRATVAHHIKVPLVGLRLLAEDKSHKVREVVLERALEEHRKDRPIFEALMKIRPSLLAQQAEDHLYELDQEEKEPLPEPRDSAATPET